MNDEVSLRTASRWLKEMSEAEDVAIAAFFNALGLGMFDEWDCDLSRAFDIFGEAEFRIAAQSGVYYADHWVGLETAVEGELADER